MKRVQRGSRVLFLERSYALWAMAMPRDIDAIDGLGGSEESDMNGGVVDG